VLVALLTLLCTACASLPPSTGKPSQAYTHTADTLLGRTIAPRLAEHPGESALYPLIHGPDALLARLALARGAERSLDVQYYIFEADVTGKMLAGELVAAADRGVRVRVLLDDLHGASDTVLATLDSHPNIEVRLFNPFAHRQARWLNFLTDFSRLDRRMHNKSMTADNQFTIVGGRNIGDAYFSADAASDFTDVDLLAAGPVTREVSAVFDDYWNSAAAYPIAELSRPPADVDQQLAALRTYLGNEAIQSRASPYVQNLLKSGLAQALEDRSLTEYWGKAWVIADRADKVLVPPTDTSGHAMPQLVQLLDGAQHELTLVSPYFVPPQSAIDWFRAMTQRGVAVRILTNAYAATDVGAVHAGYAPKRKKLLEAGVELYELKPSAYAEAARAGQRSMISRSRASLHAKTYMVDHHELFVGSLNLDPRSSLLNTEMGVVADSAELCAGSGIDAQLLDVAYKVMLEPDADGQPQLVWVTRENGLLRTYHDEPGMSALQHVGQFFLRMLPLEGEL
jgi:putative cardiolipin synthase